MTEMSKAVFTFGADEVHLEPVAGAVKITLVIGGTPTQSIEMATGDAIAVADGLKQIATTA